LNYAAHYRQIILTAIGEKRTSFRFAQLAAAANLHMRSAGRAPSLFVQPRCRRSLIPHCAFIDGTCVDVIAAPASA
jgi:hypothetical protein